LARWLTQLCCCASPPVPLPSRQVRVRRACQQRRCHTAWSHPSCDFAHGRCAPRDTPSASVPVPAAVPGLLLPAGPPGSFEHGAGPPRSQGRRKPCRRRGAHSRCVPVPQLEACAMTPGIGGAMRLQSICDLCFSRTAPHRTEIGSLCACVCWCACPDPYKMCRCDAARVPGRRLVPQHVSHHLRAPACRVRLNPCACVSYGPFPLGSLLLDCGSIGPKIIVPRPY
jgi:hypothetical protein